MNAWRNIAHVARYEGLMLARTTRFRVLGAVGIGVPLVLGILLAVLEAQGLAVNAGTALGAFVPFYVYSYAQTLLVALLVGDFRAADDRAHVAEVLNARPVATLELVAGKYLGVIGALGALSGIVLLVSVAVQAAKMSITGAPFSLAPYGSYLLLMTLPALLFMVALTFLLGAVLRQQAAVSLIAIAYTLAVVFFLGQRHGGLFDFGAFYAPLYYSDLVGLGDIQRVVEQRLFYGALALACLAGAALLYPRLPHSRRARAIARMLLGTGLVAAGALLLRMERSDAALAARRQRLLAEQLALGAAAEVTHYELDVALLGSAAPLAVRATLHCRNPHPQPLDSLVFTLNPGLRLTRAASADGTPLAWSRGEAALRVALPAPLLAGDSTTISLEYHGDIDRNAFDLRRGAPRLHKGRWSFMKGDLSAWIRPQSVYLPPRCLWYPIPGGWYTPAGGRVPQYATAEIAVELPAGLEAVTQGQPVAGDSALAPGAPAAGRRRSLWRVEHPVPQLSLQAGRYERWTATLAGIQCALYVHPAHRRQIDFFAEAQAQIAASLEQLIDALEQETGLRYPYARLSVVEVPFLVQWYYEDWRESDGLAQPGILMLEEDVLLAHNFSRDLRFRTARFGGNVDPAQAKTELLLQALFADFLGTEQEPRAGLFRSPVMQLWSFERRFADRLAPLLERSMPLFLQEAAGTSLRSRLAGGRRGWMRGMRPPPLPGRQTTEAATWDTLLLQMQQHSLEELDSGVDPQLYRQVLDAKGRPLFGLICAALGDDAFRDILGEVAAASRFGAASFATFAEAALADTGKAPAGIDLRGLVHDWIQGTHIPGFTLTRATGRKIDDGWGSIVYQVVVRVRNGEPGRGFVRVTARSRQDEAVRAVEIGGGQEVEIGMVLWERPFNVMVEPFFARNRRVLMAPVSIPEQVDYDLPRSYVRLVPEHERVVSEIIVDNEDKGFSMPVRRARRYLRPGLKGGNWEIREMPFAFGRYATSFAHKAPGDGAQPAVWRTRVANDGEYDVAYYFVPSMFGRHFGLNLATKFTLTVSHAGGVDTLRLHSDELTGGWNLLGRFRYEAGQEAVVELSDLADGRLYADAVRWRYVDPQNPAAAYEEEVTTFGAFGPGPGGRQRAGGRGQPQPTIPAPPAEGRLQGILRRFL